MILFFLVTSMAVAAVTIPFWGLTVLLGTGFYVLSEDQVQFYCILDDVATMACIE